MNKISKMTRTSKKTSLFDDHEDDDNNNKLASRRPVYNQKKFQNEFAIEQMSHQNSNSNSNSNNNSRKKFQILIELKQRLLSLFTVVNFILEYDCKKNLFADIFSGLTGNCSYFFK